MSQATKPSSQTAVKPSIDSAIQSSNYLSITLSSIVPSPYQARKAFDLTALDSLAASMKQEGLIEPIVVRAVKGGRYELISGERRWRAAKLLGWKSIDAKIIATKSEGEAAIKGLIENIQRMDLNAIEEAEAFRELHRLDKTHWTQNKIADVCGRSRIYVNRSLALLELTEEAKGGVRQRTLSREHGIELLRIQNANAQKLVAREVIQGGWSVKKTREHIDSFLNTKTRPGVSAARLPANGLMAGRPGETSNGKKGEPTIASVSPTHRTAEPTLSIDPLADVWAPIRGSAGFAPNMTWTVDYKAYSPRPGLGEMEGWVFFAKPQVPDQRKALAFWLRQLAAALEGSKPPKMDAQALKAMTQTKKNMQSLPPAPPISQPMAKPTPAPTRALEPSFWKKLWGK